MKRFVFFLLAALVLTGCTGKAAPAAPSAKAETSVPSPSPVPNTPGTAEEPRQNENPQKFSSLPFYKFDDNENLCRSQGVMFSFDLDQDGAEEKLSFALRPNNEWATAVTWNGSTVIMEKGDDPVSAEVADLDPASPYYNLLMTFDYGSDSLVTVELHPENGQLVQGKTVDGGYSLQDGTLRFSERSYLLGTVFGTRIYHGDGLVPESDWLDVPGAPSKDELETNLDGLIDIGTVLHCTRPLPCVIDGHAAELPAGTYMYCIRFMDPELDLVADVCTLDGTVARLSFCNDEDEAQDPERIYTLKLDEYFDNLFFAD